MSELEKHFEPIKDNDISSEHLKNKQVAEDFFINNLLPLTLEVFLETNGNFIFYGSGFLLNLDEILFFISATHVLKWVGQKRIYIFYNNEFILLNGFFCTTSPNKQGKDRIDLGILKIPDYLSKKLKEAPFLVRDDIDWHDEIVKSDEYYLIGYPATKNKYAIDKVAKTITSTPFFAICWESSPEIYKKLKVSEKNTIALNFDKKKVISLDGMHKTAPNLDGLSGSPVWGMSDKLKLLVAGVLIEHHQHSIKSVLVTKISPFLDVFRMLIDYERNNN